MGRRAIGLVVLAIMAIGLLVYSQVRRGPFKVSGFIEAYEIRIGSRVGGRVQQVLVDEGAEVKQGDILVALEPYDLRERRAEAEAVLAARIAEYEKLAKGFRAEEVAEAKAAYDRLAARLAELVAGRANKRSMPPKRRSGWPTRSFSWRNVASTAPNRWCRAAR